MSNSHAKCSQRLHRVGYGCHRQQGWIQCKSRNVATNAKINREKISVNFVFYTLIVIFALYSGNRVQTFETICSIALESPPRNRNEQKNIQLGLYHTGADWTIVYSACGEPESVGESLRFSFIVKQKTTASNFMFNYKFNYYEKVTNFTICRTNVTILQYV